MGPSDHDNKIQAFRQNVHVGPTWVYLAYFGREKHEFEQGELCGSIWLSVAFSHIWAICMGSTRGMLTYAYGCHFF